MKVEECIVTVERRSHGWVPGSGIRVCAGIFRPFVSSVADLRGAVLRSGLAAGVRIAAGMLLWSIVIFLFFSSVFSSLLVACIGPQVFGVPISVRAVIKSVAKTILGVVLVKFYDAVYAGDYRILFCIAFHFCDVLRRAYAGSPVAGTGTCQQRHKTTQLAGRWRWLQSQSGTTDGTDGVLGGAVVRTVSDSGLPFDVAFQFSDLLQNRVEQFAQHR